MKCQNCPCSHETYYSESYCVDWDCIAGREDRQIEFADGELGCRIHLKTAKQIADEAEEAWMKDKAQFVEWALKEGFIHE